MNVARTIPEIRRLVAEARLAGQSIGLVPTMGSLHEGHLSLIDAATAQCDVVVVSIFVNPLQFGPNEDLDGYPRTPEQDLAACKARGVAVVFMPAPEAMYDGQCVTEIAVTALGRTMCGHGRPGHFEGVCTVVAKLFNIVGADRAYFGAKDYQQATILRRMVADLNVPLEMVVCPTVREPDGLAQSSRNAYLSPEQRRQAPALYESLQLAERIIRAEHPPAQEVIDATRWHLAHHAPAGVPEYINIVDPSELSDVENTDRPVVVALAVTFGRARLIDNILVD